MQPIYCCIDLKSFYASVECVEMGFDPFKVNLVVADASRGNGAITLAICRQIHSIAVCVNMKSVTVLPSRPQLDRQANGKATQHRPSLRSVKLTAEKKKPSETLTERFRELAFNQVHESDQQ